ncbi:TlpA family protein disulfide reductase [Aquimonas voraii]|uniref:Thiol-disulfide isomerase or thioredoxin n=1 Tax=Aquimonas voraii TaxID=265719 RepID=A0A1G6RXN8_9GAMM|nr:TlpA disulfide reductase family protein [Aquimonas voraii]SDD08705.1 Thiol-disulfide isomerase or thioredoxin [Aquimonas voraii]
MTPLPQIALNLQCSARLGRVESARLQPRGILAVALLLLAGVAASALPARVAESAPAEAEAIELTLPTLDHGVFDLSQQRGRWVVVNYWATWCAPCRKEMPELDALHREREDVEVLGLAFEEIEPADMRGFLADRPVSYPIAIVDVYSPPAAFEVPRGMPMTYLLDPQGRIAHRWLGPVTKAEIEARVAGSGG